MNGASHRDIPLVFFFTGKTVDPNIFQIASRSYRRIPQPFESFSSPPYLPPHSKPRSIPLFADLIGVNMVRFQLVSFLSIPGLSHFVSLLPWQLRLCPFSFLGLAYCLYRRLRRGTKPRDSDHGGVANSASESAAASSTRAKLPSSSTVATALDRFGKEAGSFYVSLNKPFSYMN